MPPKVKPPEPTQAELRALLGTAYNALEKFLARNNDLRPEWKYYGGKIGWNLKLFDGKRNTCFIGAHEGFFRIGFLLGAKAVAEALASKLPDAVKQNIASARTYAEGRGVTLEVRSARDLGGPQLLLEIKRRS